MLKDSSVFCSLCSEPVVANVSMVFKCKCGSTTIECLRGGYCITVVLDKMEFSSYIDELGKTHSTYLTKNNVTTMLDNFHIFNISNFQLQKSLKALVLS